MSFTDRYIKVPAKLIDPKERELTNKNEDEYAELDIKVRINPYKIVSYRAAIPMELEFDEGNQICTSVDIEGGNGYLVYMPIEEFEKLLNSFDK